MPAIQKQSLSDLIIEEILKKITEGKWILGEKLPNEIELASNFNVSRNIMREAIKILENYGVLDCKTGIGTFISKEAECAIQNMNFFYDLKDNITIENLLETRLIIEPQLAYYAAKRCSDDDIELLKKISEETSKIDPIIAKTNDDLDFHITIAKCSKNILCEGLIISLITQLRTSKYAKFNYHSTEKVKKSSSASHVEILKAIAERDPDKARDLMFKHLHNRIKLIDSAVKLSTKK